MPDREKIVRVPIGPQHPALKEPESFMVDLQGEKISAVTLRLGYNHRGIEKGCEERTYVQDVYLVERVCGICSHSHSTAFVQAVEEIAGLELPGRAKYIRTLIAELERVHSHLLWLGVAGHEIGFDTLLMYTWRDRELVMDLLAEITGNRVNYGINTIGGVRRDVVAGAAAARCSRSSTLLRGADEVLHRTCDDRRDAGAAPVGRRQVVEGRRDAPRHGRARRHVRRASTATRAATIPTLRTPTSTSR